MSDLLDYPEPLDQSAGELVRPANRLATLISVDHPDVSVEQMVREVVSLWISDCDQGGEAKQ